MKLFKHGIEINVERDDASNRERAVGGLGLVLVLGLVLGLERRRVELGAGPDWVRARVTVCAH